LATSAATAVATYVVFWLFLIFATMTIAAYQHALLITTWRLSAALLTGLVATIATMAVIGCPRITLLPPSIRASSH
jgi:hypothetical protein